MSLPCLYRSTETRVSLASWNSLGCSALHSSQVVSRSNTDAVFVTGGSQSDTTWGRKRGRKDAQSYESVGNTLCALHHFMSTLR